MQLDLKSPTPLYAQLAASLKQGVANGRYRPGDALPSVRALAGEHGINPNTVMRAYQLLEQAGIIITRRGKGIFLTPNAPALCNRELGRADLDRLAALIIRLQAQGISATAIQATVRRALTESGRKNDGQPALG